MICSLSNFFLKEINNSKKQLTTKHYKIPELYVRFNRTEDPTNCALVSLYPITELKKVDHIPYEQDMGGWWVIILQGCWGGVLEAEQISFVMTAILVLVSDLAIDTFMNELRKDIALFATTE